MQIDIKHIAKLAKLYVSPDEVAKFETEMNDIIKMVENLPDVQNTGSYLDTSVMMELREDEVVKSINRDDILMNAPQTAAGCIVIPKVVE